MVVTDGPIVVMSDAAIRNITYNCHWWH